MWTSEIVKEKVEGNKIIIFAKGSKDMPMCGFSARAIGVMKLYNKPFEVVNIFDDPSIRPSLVQYSQWPTTPQVFVNGELLGGSDIIMEMHEAGTLKEKIDAGFQEAAS